MVLPKPLVFLVAGSITEIPRAYWRRSAFVAIFALHAFNPRVRIRRLRGCHEEPKLRRVQTSFKWVQTEMRAAVLATGPVQMVNLRPRQFTQNTRRKLAMRRPVKRA